MFGKGPLAPEGLFLVVVVATVLFHTFPPSSALNLTVIHNNDFHTRFVPMKSKNYAECELDNATECIGGAARTVAEVKRRFEKRRTFLIVSNFYFLLLLLLLLSR